MATILIVDDEADCRRPLAALLKHEGYEITEARDGFEGLQRLAEKKIDLVLLDMLMPGVDGITMLQGIRKQAQFQTLPVLLVTGVHDPEMLRKARNIGCQEYIFKGDTPFARMLELIKRHLGEHHVPKRRGRKPKNPRPVPPPGSDHKDRMRVSRFFELQVEFAQHDDADAA